MRDLALGIAMVILIPLGLFHPWMGIMNWAFISLASPHRQAWGFIYDAPLAMLTAVATLLGLLISKDPKHLVLKGPIIWMAIFTVWMLITYPFSLDQYSGENSELLTKVMKIMFMNFVAVAVLSTRKQVDVLIAVCAMSLGIYGIKGGIFTITTGGSFRVQGLGGFLGGNNEMALALIMAVPLLYYLLHITQNRWYRRGLAVAIFLTCVAAIGSQSRGALLAIISMSAAFLYRSPTRGKALLPFLAITLFITLFMPESWWLRMDTIDNYQEDASAMGRINAWHLAWNVATHNFFGGGFYLESNEIFSRYAPDPTDIHVAHSIYFQVLGQHGFVGLFLFLGMWISAWRTSRWISANHPSPNDQMLARMIEVSLIGFAAGGAFLNLAYFDGPYYLLIALVVMRYKLTEKSADGTVNPQPERSRL